jgi:GTP1/Obg family GTP-binding protein
MRIAKCLRALNNAMKAHKKLEAAMTKLMDASDLAVSQNLEEEHRAEVLSLHEQIEKNINTINELRDEMEVMIANGEVEKS